MRKNPEADLKLKHKKALELGYIGALVLILIIFMAFRQVEVESETITAEVPEFKVEEIPPTEQIKRPPPPARPAVPIPTENEDVPEDETIEPTEIDLSDIPPPPEPPQTDESANIFVAYDEPPMPIGGFEAIQRNLKYPDIARKAGIEGRVIVNVLIDVDGRVVDTKILRSLGHSGCDEAAIEAIRSVRWKPAKQRDRPVKVWVGIPVIFKLK